MFKGKGISEIFSQLHGFRIPVPCILVRVGTFFFEVIIHKNLEFTPSSADRMYKHSLSVLPPSNPAVQRR